MLIMELKRNRNDRKPDQMESNCDMVVESSKDPKQHKMDTHEQIEIEKFGCNKCEYSCTRKSEMKKHMAEKHPKFCQLKCTKCDKTFSKNCELERHILDDHVYKPFEC